MVDPVTISLILRLVPEAIGAITKFIDLAKTSGDITDEQIVEIGNALDTTHASMMDRIAAAEARLAGGT